MIDLRLYTGATSPVDVIMRFIFGWGEDVLGCMHIGPATSATAEVGEAGASSAAIGASAASSARVGVSTIARAVLGSASPARMALGPVEVC